MSTDPAPSNPFAGSIPENYQSRLVPLLFEGYARDLAERVFAEGAADVLETAAGTGVVTRELAARLPAGGSLTATDFSPEMLEVARGAMDAGPSVRFEPADATALPFEDESFDSVACQFGVMFFPDEPKGYAEAARVLRPGGRFCFSVWDDLARNPLAESLGRTLARLSGAGPSRFLDTPYRALDMTTILRDLQGAGFGEIGATVLPRPCRSASSRDAVAAVCVGTPMALEIEERGLTSVFAEEAVGDLAARFAGGDAGAPIEAPMQAVVFEARLG